MNESLPVVIQDLAYILIVAGITTVLFKKLKQPLVLGYIVSGFLAGPYMPYMPTIGDISACNDWGQIGVIFIMFTLGLEFSFKKIVKMGISPILCVCMIMACMMGIGNFVGNMFGWGEMDAMFLGGMLSMSSTTIIYKAYNEMQLSHKKFAGNVLSVLILEDIMGILLMVILSTIAATRQFEGSELIHCLMSLGSILIVWFLVGIFVLPILLKRYKRYMNQEIMMIVSLALCFVLVILSNKAGYSPSFGAFMMGSILAETVEAEQIEKSVGSIKDFFGAIFFVSVGMLVNPEIVIDYWFEILVLVISILLGQTILGSISYMLTGSSLKDSIYSGFSMTQIGEFAFIIASVGESLGVTSPKLYPIVVAVSIITTFLTPYMIKAASPVSRIIEDHVHINTELPSGLGAIDINKSKILSTWKKFLTALIYQTVAYFVLSYAFLGMIMATFKPLMNNIFKLFTDQPWGHWTANAICCLIGVIVVSPFIRAVCMRKNRSVEARYLCESGILNKIFFYITIVTRIIICTSLLYILFDYMCPLLWWWNALISLAIVLISIASRTVKWVSIRVERIFKQNLHRRENLHKGPAYAHQLSGQDLHISRLTVPELSTWAGHTLRHLCIGQNNGVHIASIKRGSLRYNIPGGESRIFPGDILEIVGDDESIETLKQRMDTEVVSEENAQNAEPITLKKLTISKYSRYVGCKLGESAIREEFHCTVIGFEDEQGNLLPTDAESQIQADSRMWVVGEFENLELLELVTDPPEELHL